MLRYVVLHVGATWEAWRAEHQPPFALEGTLTALADGTLLLDVGDGELRGLADLVAEHVEARRDALGDRFVGRVRLRLDLLATPIPPPCGRYMLNGPRVRSRSAPPPRVRPTPPAAG